MRHLASFVQQYSTGTRKMPTTANSIPPKEGMAIGTIMSEPLPVEVRMGINANMVVALVIRAGLTRRFAAAIVAWRTAWIESGLSRSKR